MNIITIFDHESEKIRTAHVIREDPDQNVLVPHTHFHWEIVYFVSGEISYSSGNEIVRLSPYTLIITPPDRMHAMILEENSDYERYNIIVKNEVLERKIEKHSRHVYKCGAEHAIGRIFREFDMYAKLFSPNSADFDAISEILTDEIIFIINHLNMQEISGETDTGDTYRRVIYYIENNLPTIDSVDGIAKALFLSRSALFKLFREHAGTTPHEYLLSRRLVMALRKMRDGLSAGDAAVQSGFQDYPTFYRSFKKKFGKSPRDFRQAEIPEKIVF